jgi:hypothetical protein
MIGRKEAYRSEAIVHLLQVGGAGQDVVARIKRIKPKSIANAYAGEVIGVLTDTMEDESLKGGYYGWLYK